MQGAGQIKLLWGKGVPFRQINDFITHLAPKYFIAGNLPGLVSPIAKRGLKQGRSVRFVIFYVRFEMTQNVCGSKVGIMVLSLFCILSAAKLEDAKNQRNSSTASNICAVITYA